MQTGSPERLAETAPLGWECIWHCRIESGRYVVTCFGHDEPWTATFADLSEYSRFSRALDDRRASKATVEGVDASSIHQTRQRRSLAKTVRSLDEIDAPTASLPAAPRVPKPHQLEAVDAIALEFGDSSRTQLVAPCGTGKTFISILVAERLQVELVVVFVPRRCLVDQTIVSWKSSVADMETLSIYSDDGGTRNPQEIEAFLRQPGRRLIVSTYHSASLLRAALVSTATTISLAIYDEAHHTAGEDGNMFAQSVTDDFPAAKRLFMTATRRILRCGGGGTSMDDEEIFGRVSWQISFREAIKQGLIADYRVVALSVTNVEARTLIREDETPSDGFSPRQVAAHVALAKGIVHFGLAKLLTFHDRVRDAQRFTEQSFPGSFPQVRASLGHTDELFAGHVNGKMNADLRAKILDGIDTASVGFVANARCLTEGVDLPDLDAVAFLGARRSKIDILQAIGRALRQPAGRPGKIAYIFVPLIVEDGEIDTAPLVDLLSALREEDDELSDCVLRFSDSSTSTHGSAPTGASTRNVEVLHHGALSKQTMESLVRNVEACLLEGATISWTQRYQALRAYVDEHKRLPTSRTGAVNWMAWLEWQRGSYRRGDLSRHRSELLEALGVQWYPSEQKWDVGFDELVKFVASERVGWFEAGVAMSHDHVTSSGYPLGQWVRTQHRRYREGYLSPARVEQLESVPGWKWVTRQRSRWEIRLGEAAEFCREHPGSTPPQELQSSTGISLREWFNQMRVRRTRGTLAHAQQLELEAIDGWTWTKNAEGCPLATVRATIVSRTPSACEVPAAVPVVSPRPCLVIATELASEDEKRVLLALRSSADGYTRREICVGMRINASKVNHALGNLERAGKIERLQHGGRFRIRA